MSPKKTVAIVLTISFLILVILVATILSLREDGNKTQTVEPEETIQTPGPTAKKRRKTSKKRKWKRPSVKKMLSRLDLSDKQKLQIKELERNKSSRKEKRAKIKELKKKLGQSLKDNASHQELLGFHEQIYKLKARMAAEDFEYMLEIRRILTPKQWKKLSRLKRKYRRKMKKRKRADFK